MPRLARDRLATADVASRARTGVARSGLMWAYIAVRAARLAFTADESISYGFLHGQTALAGSANNQWLNTWLMRVAQALFGQSPWALRLPNVLAFGIYGAASLTLVAGLRRSTAR